MLQLVSQVFQIFCSLFSLVVRLFLSLFPFYQQLSGLQTQMIAAAIGIPATVITVVIASIKVFWRFSKGVR